MTQHINQSIKQSIIYLNQATEARAHKTDYRQTAE